MTEFQVGVIETEERKETLYSQTPLYRGEGGGGGAAGRRGGGAAADPGYLECTTNEWCN